VIKRTLQDGAKACVVGEDEKSGWKTVEEKNESSLARYGRKRGKVRGMLGLQNKGLEKTK